MFENFFKTTYRSLWKNKGYSFLNVFGLTIGIACAALIFLWVEDEFSYDQFHAKKDRIYFIEENQKYDTYTATFGSTPGVLAPAMQAEIPGIAAACRVTESDASKLFTIGDKAVYADGHYVDSSFFNIFSFPFVQGGAKTAFAQLHSLVITEKAAKKFFGSEANAVGKTVRVDNKQDYVVTGVVKDIPEHSSVQFEWVAPFQVWFEQSPWAQFWGNNCLSTYVELKPGTDAASVNRLLFNFIQQREPKSIARPFLFPMKDWRLRDEFDNGKQTGGGRIEYVRLFSLIAWIILFIACINFMNLATARSDRRAREVGVRKVLGAQKGTLVWQFIGESLLVAAVAAIFAVVVVALLLPAFNMLVQKQLSLGLTQPLHFGVLASITVICGLVAGSYPSLYLSSFNPVVVLKSLRVKGGSVAFVRKGLVILQFSVSVVLIISTIVVYQQIQHVKSRNLGFARANLLEVGLQGEVGKYFSAVKQDMLNTGVVEKAAGSDYTILYGGNNTGSLTWQGKAPNAQILVSGRYVTPEFLSTVGMKLQSGREFITTDSTSSKNINVIITQSLEKLMGGNAVGKTMWNDGDTSGTKMTVIGVCNDYVYGNMYGKPDPVVFICTAPQHLNKLYLRLTSQSSIEKALASIEDVMKRNNPAYPFSYVFVDDQFNRMFLNEMLIGRLARVFAALAILISCLGLFGLAAYTAERRTKEIGIRKVLGANVKGLALLLSKDFLQLVIISCVVAFPVAWWLMNNWLQDYRYRITIGWWVFLLAGIMAVAIALITVSFQAIKAAMANPVKSLRTE